METVRMIESILRGLVREDIVSPYQILHAVHNIFCNGDIMKLYGSTDFTDVSIETIVESLMQAMEMCEEEMA